MLEASSAHEALDIFEQRPDIDLLITDQAMPGMTGSELIDRISKLKPSLPIILATGYGETPADRDVAVHRLGKPFSQSDLRRALGAVSNLERSALHGRGA